MIYAFDGATRASLDGVVVRITNSASADGVDHRELRLPSCDAGQFLVVSAPGYETSFVLCNGSNAYYVGLNKLSTNDNINYTWSSANDCGICHAGQLSAGYDENDEWGKSAHARVFVDPYFETMYRGTDIYGQATSASTNFGPGFRLDHPDQAGNCAYCHAPSAILPSLAATDLSSYYPRPAGANGEGITCDVCHKVSGVTLNDNKYPRVDKPGVLSLKFLRLSNSFVFGPFSNILLPLNDDSRRHVPSSCAPFLSTSEFCAVCHYGKFNDVTIYNSYGEWRDSDYGKSATDSTYKTCQDCHMSNMDVKNVNTPLSRRSACSETGDKYQDFDHNLLDVGQDASGKEIPRMIQGAASLKVKLKYEPDTDGSLRVRVEVENIKAGHKFPTDSPLRQLILVVSATDQFESPLVEVKGDKLPDWAGISNPTMSQNGVEGYAGLPGTIYANLLDAANPLLSAAYWNKIQNGKPSDTRLLPGDPQVSNFAFDVPDLGNIHITVKLIYRFAFFDLMEQKDWVRPDIVVASADCSVSPDQAKDFDCQNVQP
jgi:hypothetical protein